MPVSGRTRGDALTKLSRNTYPAAVIGRLLQLSERRVQQLAKEGILPKASRGRYDLVGCVQAYVGFLQGQLEKRVAERSDGFEDQRLRHQTAKAELAELELAELRGELIGMGAAEHGIATLLSGLQAQLLAIPATIAEELAALDDPKEIHAIAEAAIRQALQAVADAETTIPAAARDRGRGASADRGRSGRAAPASKPEL